MLSLDLYEFKETLKELSNKEISKLKFEENKGIVILEVGKNSKKLDERLRSLGHKDGERVMGVVQ